jgi:hypothetical protein
MTVFKVETYVVKPEKHKEYLTLVKEWVAYIENKEKCKELKSWKLFSQTIKVDDCLQLGFFRRVIWRNW